MGGTQVSGFLQALALCLPVSQSEKWDKADRSSPSKAPVECHLFPWHLLPWDACHRLFFVLTVCPPTPVFSLPPPWAGAAPPSNPAPSLVHTTSNARLRGHR